MDALFPTYNRWDLAVKSAKGTKIIDQNNKEYLDFVSGIGVCNLGHRHPEVQNAVESQLNKVWHVSNLFQIDLQQEVAQLLVDYSDGDAVFFCNSGAEANEAALKLARKYTKKSKVITFKQSFHGRTFATMTATGQAKIHDGFGPLLHEFVYLPFNDISRLEEEIDDSVAAVMVEVIQGEGGVVPANVEFLKKAEELCGKSAALLILDEVQTGIGRTGKPFAYQHYGISPDIITVAKGLGSGFPVGAMIGKEYLKESFGPGSHGTTFGGNPLASAAAKATLEIIFQDTFLQDVTEKGDYLLGKLNKISSDVEWIEEVRGKGLMVGIVCNQDITYLLKPLREQGLLALVAGPKVIRLLPPLTVTKEEIDQGLEILEKILKENSVARL